MPLERMWTQKRYTTADICIALPICFAASFLTGAALVPHTQYREMLFFPTKSHMSRYPALITPEEGEFELKVRQPFTFLVLLR